MTTRHESIYFPGGALKAVGAGRIGGYLVIFTGADDRDSYNEYFTGQTDYGLNYYKNQPVLFHHGQNDDMVTPIGMIDTLTVDTKGVYAEAQLDINHEDPTIRDYARTAYTQVNAGKLFWSSGSANHLVRVTDEGQITQWFIVEGSLTPTPAEQRGRTQVEVLRAALRAFLNTEQTAKESDKTIEPVVMTDHVPNRKNKMMQRRTTPAAKMDQSSIMNVLDGLITDPQQKWDLAMALAAADAGEEMAEGDAPLAAAPVAPPAETPPNMPSVPMASAQRQMSPNELAHQIAERMNYMQRTAPATAQLPAGGGGQNPNTPAPESRITVRSKYHDLSDIDMAWMYQLRSGIAAKSGKQTAVNGTAFQREMLEKAQRNLTYEGTRDALKMHVEDANRILSIRSNELDNTASAGQILEWIPTIWSSELWRRVRLDNEVAQNFRTVEMPSNPYKLPIESTDPTVSYVPETTNESQLTLSGAGNPIPDSVLSSGNVILTAGKLGLRVGFSTEAEEDSIIPFIPQLREQGVRAMANAVDNVLLNGDTSTTINTNINDIDGTPAATSKYLIFNGLIKNALVTATGQTINLSGGSPTLQTIRSLRGKLQSTLNYYGLRPDDLVGFVDPSTWFKMLSIDEINSWLNNGRNATVNNGMLPNIDGIPFWPSQELALANSSGKISETASNNLYGRIVLAAKTGWTIGYRRHITTSVDFLSYYDSYQMTATLRVAFINKDTAASAVAYGVGV